MLEYHWFDLRQREKIGDKHDMLQVNIVNHIHLNVHKQMGTYRKADNVNGLS